jgi:hypothetical protein
MDIGLDTRSIGIVFDPQQGQFILPFLSASCILSLVWGKKTRLLSLN